MGARKILPPTKVIDLKNDKIGNPLKDSFLRAFEYSDCWVEDSRLVILNARDAKRRGARILPRTEDNNLQKIGRICNESSDPVLFKHVW